jgi:oligoribonuclease NrnB/cAMP/cGMP phosphodiesterase (DHH superfamily)
MVREMTKPLCIYHGNCQDGFAAAWVVRRHFPNADFHGGVYQDPPPDVTGRDVILVDFSYKRPVLEQIADAANSVVVLDHHKTAEADLAPFKIELCGSAEFSWADVPGIIEDFRDLRKTPIIIAHFDMARSGAQMAWDAFHDAARPNLVDYVGDRDLWKFDLPFSREVNAYIFAHNYTFENWDHLDRELRTHMDVQRVAEMGGAIEKKHHKDVAELVSFARREMIIGGIVVPVANLPYTVTSDAGHLMATQHPSRIGVCYTDTPDGRVFSLRSTDDGPDVSAIAKRYGGGGHAHAAGFRVALGWEGDP